MKYILLFFVAISFVSCGSSNVVSINIVEPNGSKTYKVNDTIFIKGNIVSSDILSGYRVNMINPVNNVKVIDWIFNINSDIIGFDTFYVNTISDKTGANLWIQAVDKDGAIVKSTSSTISLNP